MGDDEDFEKRLNKEKSFINTSKNHTAEFEKQLEEHKEEYRVRSDIEKRKEDIKNKLSGHGDIMTSSDSSFNIVGLIIPIVTVVIVISVGLIIIGELNDVIGESTQNISSSTLTGLIAPFGSSALFLPLLLFPIIIIFVVFNRIR